KRHRESFFVFQEKTPGVVFRKSKKDSRYHLQVIKIAGIVIDEALIRERFVRSPGPGGQNVNKVATSVELRFDAGASGLPEEVKSRLQKLAGHRLTAEG